MEQDFIFEKILGEVTLTEYMGDDEIVIVPDTFNDEPVTTIAQNAFYCENTTQVILPKSVKNICKFAFATCNNLVKLIAENEDIELGVYVFNDSINLEEVSFNLIEKLEIVMQVKVIKKLLYNWDNVIKEQQVKLISMINKNRNLKHKLMFVDDSIIILLLLNEIVIIDIEDIDLYHDYHVKNNNTSIVALLLEYKFKNYTNNQIDDFKERKELIEIGLVLPTLNELKKQWDIKKVDDVISIEKFIGNNSKQIIPIGLDDGSRITRVKPVNYRSFWNLESLKINAEIKKIEFECFNECRNLKKIVLPDSVTEIGESAFKDCFGLEEINLSENLIVIDKSAFLYCKSLKEIHLPPSIMVLKDKCFENCQNLKTINLPDKLQMIAIDSFYNCSSLAEIIIPKSVYHLGIGSFGNCKNLKKVIILSDLIKINECVFENCISLTDIQLPDTVEIIDNGAFHGCTSLQEVTIPASVRRINFRAFNDCTNLKKINFLGDIPEFDEDVFKNTKLEKEFN